MNVRIYNIQVQELRIVDIAKGKGKEIPQKIFKPKPLANSPLNPIMVHEVTEPREVEVKKSRCRCIIM